MPHHRNRYLRSGILSDLKWAPIVSVLGMRQVGKTTLLTEIGESYVTLDDDSILQDFERGDWSRLESGRHPIIVDEAQKNAGLFDRVKLIVDRTKRPGQFLLTGSVRFLSRKQIRESLTGRTSLLELLPLTLAEAHSAPLFDFPSQIAELGGVKFIEKAHSRELFSAKAVADYVESGGMPGVCFKRDAKIISRMRNAHIETLLMRDLQMLIRTRVPYVKLRSILSVLASQQGQPLSLSAIARQVQLSTPTVTQMIRGFQDLFVIRPHGKTLYFTDCGIAGFLGASHVENPLFHMERFVYQELYAQLTYLHHSQFKLENYSTRGGARIPFVVQRQSGPTLAIAVDASEGASEKSLKSLISYGKRRQGSILSIVLHAGSSGYIASTGAICIPYTWIA